MLHERTLRTLCQRKEARYKKDKYQRWAHLYEVPRRGKFIEMERSVEVIGDQEGRVVSYYLVDSEFLFDLIEKFLSNG